MKKVVLTSKQAEKKRKKQAKKQELVNRKHLKFIMEQRDSTVCPECRTPYGVYIDYKASFFTGKKRYRFRCKRCGCEWITN